MSKSRAGKNRKEVSADALKPPSNLREEVVVFDFIGAGTL